MNRKTTPKEKCFETAVEKLQDYQRRQGREPPEIDHQQQWTRSHGESWEPTSFGGEIIYSILKTMRLIKQETLGGEPVDASRPRQVRYPDLTVSKPDGSKVVVDTKFDRPSGGRDSWQKGKGMGGTDQRTDYNDINRQQQGDDAHRDLSLDPDSCKCDGDPQPVYELEPQALPESQFYVAPPPFAVPAVPSIPPVPAPIPVF